MRFESQARYDIPIRADFEVETMRRDDLKHGIFTYFVLKGLGGAADGNGDKAVAIRELYAYLSEEVPRKALEPPLDREQIPQIQPGLKVLGEMAEQVLVQY